MAKSFLYHLTPARNVSSILAAGLEPRPGRYQGHSWPARVWLCTNKETVFQQWLKLMPRDYFPPEPVGKIGGALIHRSEPLVVIVIDRKSVKTNPNDSPAKPSARPVAARRMAKGIVWTDQHIPPSAIMPEPLTHDFGMMDEPRDYTEWSGFTKEKKAKASRKAWITPAKPRKQRRMKPGKRILALARNFKRTPEG